VRSSGQKRYLLNHEKNLVFTEGFFKKFEEYFVTWWTHVPVCPHFTVLQQFSFVEILKKMFCNRKMTPYAKFNLIIP
jgi:hypothetical protein